ncbi:MAG: hypothetical protein FJ123_11745 [Deltaproteobacteria bacterium]|nr:hypothetical protein [Deltaproteobacteria bacterium]
MSDQTPSKTKITLELDEELLERSIVHKNIGQEFIVTTTDKIKLSLLEHRDILKAKIDWIAPTGILITLIATLAATNFTRSLGLAPEVWKDLFIACTILDSLWLFHSIYRVIKFRRKGSVESLIQDLKIGSPDEVKPKMIEKYIDISPKVNIGRVSEILKIMYPEYSLGYTKLLSPKAPNAQIEGHSHGTHGYFNWLDQTGEKKYSFKFWDFKKPINFIEMSVDHINNKIHIRCQLDSGRSKTFVSELVDKLKA